MELTYAVTTTTHTKTTAPVTGNSTAWQRNIASCVKSRKVRGFGHQKKGSAHGTQSGSQAKTNCNFNCTGAFIVMKHLKNHQGFCADTSDWSRCRKSFWEEFMSIQARRTSKIFFARKVLTRLCTFCLSQPLSSPPIFLRRSDKQSMDCSKPTWLRVRDVRRCQGGGSCMPEPQ